MIFSRTGGDLFSFVMGYEYNREMDFEAKVRYFAVYSPSMKMSWR